MSKASSLPQVFAGVLLTSLPPTINVSASSAAMWLPNGLLRTAPQLQSLRAVERVAAQPSSLPR